MQANWEKDSKANKLFKWGAAPTGQAMMEPVVSSPEACAFGNDCVVQGW